MLFLVQQKGQQILQLTLINTVRQSGLPEILEMSYRGWQRQQGKIYVWISHGLSIPYYGAVSSP